MVAQAPKTGEAVAAGETPPLPVLKFPTAFGSIEVAVTASHLPGCVRLTLSGGMKQAFNVSAREAAGFARALADEAAKAAR